MRGTVTVSPEQQLRDHETRLRSADRWLTPASQAATFATVGLAAADGVPWWAACVPVPLLFAVITLRGVLVVLVAYLRRGRS